MIPFFEVGLGLSVHFFPCLKQTNHRFRLVDADWKETFPEEAMPPCLRQDIPLLHVRRWWLHWRGPIVLLFFPAADAIFKGQRGGQRRCWGQSHSCGQAERGAKRMPVGFAMEKDWTKKLSQASSSSSSFYSPPLFFWRASQQQWPFLKRKKYIFEENLFGRIERRGDLCRREESGWNSATSPFHWKFSFLASSNHFFDIKENPGN